MEFITTTTYVDKYLKPDDRILEVGAATGRYSLHYAKAGYQVDSVELVLHNIDQFKRNMTSDMNVTINQGNACDLSMFNDNTFDITLILGPLYHLYSEEDKLKAIEEAYQAKLNLYLNLTTLIDGYFFSSYVIKLIRCLFTGVLYYP